MKRTGLAAALCGLAFLGLLGSPGTSIAGVHVDVGFYAPFPSFVVSAPPRAVMLPAPPPRMVGIPRTEISYVPAGDINVFFYRGHWYRPTGRNWYRARAYDGPWGYIVPSRVPRVLMTLPADYYYAELPHHKGHYKRHGHYGRERWRNW